MTYTKSNIFKGIIDTIYNHIQDCDESVSKEEHENIENVENSVDIIVSRIKSGKFTSNKVNNEIVVSTWFRKNVSELYLRLELLKYGYELTYMSNFSIIQFHNIKIIETVDEATQAVNRLERKLIENNLKIVSSTIDNKKYYYTKPISK